ncbi:hypothetical protein BpHYR1_033938 [Brachionus plicatilis]|uniref:Uncharacterized protein n=1 Tax=Brachionus plicatilis TaxID=10195 RepID=A0A3M7PYB6_BRAPC|nr:hypothetical protein BpHYR1_033938 [Brachionus plicatilis]
MITWDILGPLPVSEAPYTYILCYEIVHETTGHKINKFKFYADRGVRPASYELGDRVWILKESKLKGISRKLSRKWNGSYTKCFSPPENVQYESLNDTQTPPGLNFSKTIPAPPEISAEPQFSATTPVSFSTPIDPEPMRFENFSAHLGEPYNQNESYWLDNDAVQDEGKESMFQPNYYLQNQVRNTTTTTSPPQRPIRKRKPPDRYEMLLVKIQVTIEVRIDYVVDNRIEKTDLEEFLLESGGRERGGIGR